MHYRWKSHWWLVSCILLNMIVHKWNLLYTELHMLVVSVLYQYIIVRAFLFNIWNYSICNLKNYGNYLCKSVYSKNAKFTSRTVFNHVIKVWYQKIISSWPAPVGWPYGGGCSLCTCEVVSTSVFGCWPIVSTTVGPYKIKDICHCFDTFIQLYNI